VTNALTGIGEALLDSVPMVCIVGDVARGDKYKPFQVHELPQVGLLKQVTKGVFEVQHQAEIPGAVREAFRLALCGEPGPTAVVVPYNLLIEKHHYNSPPLGPPELAFDDGAFHAALALLGNQVRMGLHHPAHVGLYVGQGCLDHAAGVVQAAELLQAPVATSVSGKGAINECHPLAVGWGYGPQGTATAEHLFKMVDVVLAIGVRYSEVSTGFYSIPQPHHLIHVDANPNNLGKVYKADVCVHADAGVFLAKLLEQADCVRREPNPGMQEKIRQYKVVDAREHARLFARCGVDPMAFVLALRRATCPDALVFVDVTMCEHWAAEAFLVANPRTYFNPTDNQAMGWSIPAAIGAQRAWPGRQTVTLTGDGCFLMTAMELSTAAREHLPVKFFILDDQAYHYMQELQKQAYRRTTATMLARLDYPALAQGWGLAYMEINCLDHLDSGLRTALDHPGPVLIRVVTDYGKRHTRWIEATKKRFVKELNTEQKVRFIARVGSRSLDIHPQND